MSAKIKLLNEDTIGKIAAGEVVERPAAAIKELVENCLDAGASAVTVQIRDGGITYFRVTDNGSGIQSTDIRMAFERHATSKISTASDLSAISTLGFRGEALASIAAVAHVTCTTRTADEPIGLKVQNNGGIIASIEETACPQGTTFVVKDLFFNTPVRLKFLKKPATEAGFVADLMMHMILSRPDVSFRYISQGKTMYHSAGDGQLESAVFSIYGKEMIRTMRRVQGHQSGVLIEGYVGIGEGARSNHAHQSFFINGRYMKSNLLSSSVDAACRERVMIGKYPSCVLHLTMPYDIVDVNVHPNKLEVRFQDEQAIAEAVQTIVLEALQDRDALERPTPLILDTQNQQPKEYSTVTKQNQINRLDTGFQPEVHAIDNIHSTTVGISDPPKPDSNMLTSAQGAHAQPEQIVPVAPIKHTQNIVRTEATAAQRYFQSIVLPETSGWAKTETKTEKTEQISSFDADKTKPMRLIGTVFNTFILVEYEDHLLLIDQHAVHERLLFDKLIKECDQKNAGQQLLVPIVLHVSRKEQQLLQDNREVLENIGLSIESFGESQVSVRSIPMILGEPQTQSLVRQIIDQLINERGVITLEKRRASILQIACKKAVKGGDRLSEDEIRDLVTRMIDQKVTPTCPHGRPLVISLSHSELDKRFRRIQ